MLKSPLWSFKCLSPSYFSPSFYSWDPTKNDLYRIPYLFTTQYIMLKSLPPKWQWGSARCNRQCLTTYLKQVNYKTHSLWPSYQSHLILFGLIFHVMTYPLHLHSPFVLNIFSSFSAQPMIFIFLLFLPHPPFYLDYFTLICPFPCAYANIYIGFS